MNEQTSRNQFTLNRKSFIGAGLGSLALLGLAACSDAPAPTKSDDAKSSDTPNTTLDAKAFDALVAEGSVAEASVIDANAWSKAVKDAGKLRIGCTETSQLFSLRNPDDGRLRGFDAGIGQLLSRYILGDENKIEVVKVTSDTRESVLQNDQVDIVLATYSITDKRKQVISFAGPYYTSQQGILVKKDNDSIKGLDDLAGKTVAAQSGSTGPSILAEYAPKATVQEFKTDEEARTALEQGRIDAYVVDLNLQLGTIVKNPNKYKLAGDPFGPIDPYGVGMKLNSEGVSFVNDFLQKLEDGGTWEKLWKICIGDRTGVTTVPTPPKIGA